VSDPVDPERVAAPSEQVTRFEDLVEAESPGLYGALCLIARDRFEAEDVMQEAFLKVWERWDPLGGRAALVAGAVLIRRWSVRRAP